MKLNQKQVDEVLTQFPEVNSFIEKYKNTTMYGRFSKIGVTIRDNYPKELARFRFMIRIPVKMYYTGEAEHEFYIEYSKKLLYQELKTDSFSDVIIRVIEDELNKHFKNLIISGYAIESVVLSKNRYPVYWEDEL